MVKRFESIYNCITLSARWFDHLLYMIKTSECFRKVGKRGERERGGREKGRVEEEQWLLSPQSENGSRVFSVREGARVLFRYFLATMIYEIQIFNLGLNDFFLYIKHCCYWILILILYARYIIMYIYI